MQPNSHPSPSAGVVTSLPKAWEREETFHDVLYEWMQRAPWLGLSAAAHLVAFFILSAIPWAIFDRPEVQEFVSEIEKVPEPLFEEPEKPPVEEIVETETEELPVIRDIEMPVEVEQDFDVPMEELAGEPDNLADAPFDLLNSNSIIGIGPGAGSLYGNRGRGGSRDSGGGGTHTRVLAGLEWLVRHQSPEGYWSAAGFMHEHAGEPCDCDGGGDANQDVGLTGLALLALLGDGHSTREGLYRDNVARGVRWLRNQQDYDTGLIGLEIGDSFVYDHAIGALALCEAYYFSRSPTLKIAAERSIRYIEKARAAYGAWRYDVPSQGDADTSVTGWMVLALKSAQEGGIKVDQDALVGALSWIDEATDETTGRVGYEQRGSASARVTGVNDHFPTSSGEAMTAVGLLSRFFLGQHPDDTPVMAQHADLMLRALPRWEPEAYGCDMYYWYYASYAMFQMGGVHWKRWNAAMKSAVVESQRQDGHARGSWDPVGPWGHKGGRVYSTSLMVLCLQVYYRYGRIVTAR